MKELSVVMPVYNAAPYLKSSIESILNQTFSAFEFIIINDGSSDNSLEIIRSYSDERIIVIDQENKGLARALNIGIRQSSGNYIAIMNADDISASDRLEKQLNFLSTRSECVLVGSNAHVMDGEGRLLYTSKIPLTWEEIKNCLPESPFFHSSTMFKKQAWLWAGGYMEEITHHFEDKLLWNKFAEFGKMSNLEEPLIYYRLQPSSITNHNILRSKELRSICNNILKKGKATDSDLDQLNKLIRPLSKRQALGNYFYNLGNIYLSHNPNRKEALKNFIFSLCYRPGNVRAWFGLVKAVVDIKKVPFIRFS